MDSLKVKGWKKIYHTNFTKNKKKSSSAEVLYQDQISQTITKKMTSDEKVHFIILKGGIHQEDTAILNVYVAKS